MILSNFLRHVLPEDGIYCLAISNPTTTSMRHRYYTDISVMASDAIACDDKGNDVYYCVSSLTDRRRIQDNVKFTKLLAIDIDCGAGKTYATCQDAAVACSKFIATLKLPKPMFVMSGYGLHAYWILDRSLLPEQWIVLSSALKRAVSELGFGADAGLIGNSVLLLRLPETNNHKNGQVKPVKLLVKAEHTTADILSNLLSDYIEPVMPSKPTAVSERVNSTLLDKISTQPTYQPADASVIANKCRQVAWAIDNQDEVLEPMWYGLLGIATYCKDPEQTAIAWSKNHPQYNESSTLSKLAQWQKSATGPTTCEKFFTDRPTGCNKCPLKGKIVSPAQIGSQFQQVDMPQDVPDKVAHIIEIPKPFKRTSNGIVVTIEGTDTSICSFNIYPVSYGLDESLGYEVVRFRWDRQHVGWVELVFRQAYLVAGNKEFATVIADQGILLADQNKTNLFQYMLRSYINELKQVQTLTNLYQTMGWKQNYTSFVLGNTLLKRTTSGKVIEETVKMSNAVSRHTSDYYRSKGDPQAWCKLTNILEVCDLPAHKFILGVGFSAPLYRFTGLKGITISLHGPTGGGKSLAQYWMQSIYGDPNDLHFSAKYTQNSLFSRMGLYSNLPMSVDEVTMMKDDEVSDFCYWVTQGRDKIRLNRDSRECDAKTWATPVVVSTNTSLQSKLIASRLDTDAQMARLLEVPVPMKGLFQDSSDLGRKIHYAIHGCYGHAGRVFITNLLAMGELEIIDMINAANATFSSEFGVSFTGPERFWEQSIILANLAGKLAKQWGLIDYNYESSTEWVLEQLAPARQTVNENKADVFDLLAEYMTEYASTILTVEQTGRNAVVFNPYRLPKADVRMRISIVRKCPGTAFDRGTIMIDRRHFRQWLSAKGGDYKVFKLAIDLENADATPKSCKYSMGKGTPIKLAQVYVIGVSLRHPRLVGLLETAVTSVNDLALNELEGV